MIKLFEQFIKDDYIQSNFIGRTFDAYGLSFIYHQGKYKIIANPIVRTRRLDDRFFIDIPIALTKKEKEKYIDRSDIDPYGEEEWSEEKQVEYDYDKLVMVFYDHKSPHPLKFKVGNFKTGYVNKLCTIIGVARENSFCDTRIEDVNLLEQISDFFNIQREADLKLIYK
jgi:hypothetical protein